jgi:sporulation protein YlmC with PRC-barrel domain
MSNNIDTSSIIERPVYTKDESYVGVVDSIDKTQEMDNLIIRGKMDLRKYSIPRKFIVSFYDGRLLLDMTIGDFTQYEI